MDEPKTSSKGVLTEWEKRFLTPEQIEAVREKIRSAPKIGDDKRRKIAATELRGLTASGPRLLSDLANCKDDQRNWFCKRWPAGKKSEFLIIRDDLRRIWAKQIEIQDANNIVLGWLSEQRHSLHRIEPTAVAIIQPFFPDLRTGKLLPLPTTLRVRIAMACLEHYSRMKVCANPDCKFPYFLAGRKTQRVCEQGECTAWAQRQYANKWWKENRAKT